jgi:hypothetical protein
MALIDGGSGIESGADGGLGFGDSVTIRLEAKDRVSDAARIS